MNDENHTGSTPPAQVEPSRKFQGVWIPASLWLRRDLTWFQKCLLAEVASLGECFASNTYLARMMGSTPSNVAKELSKLRKKGLILDWGFDGRRRQITVAREVHPNPFGEPEQGLPTGKGSIDLQVNKDTRVGASGLKRSKETASTDADIEVLPNWKPDGRTKEEKLRTLKNPKRIPSEREFERFIEEYELDEIINKRSNLYDSLTDRKFHHWDERLRKWRPIRDWKKYVMALNQTIGNVF